MCDNTIVGESAQRACIQEKLMYRMAEERTPHLAALTIRKCSPVENLVELLLGNYRLAGQR